MNQRAFREHRKLWYALKRKGEVIELGQFPSFVAVAEELHSAEPHRR
ncbi:hypothetical protein FHX15_005406 [Rhizobium sp. BK650]|nr:hypothetical protein [Rhizobium sp. BK650]